MQGNVFPGLGDEAVGIFGAIVLPTAGGGGLLCQPQSPPMMACPRTEASRRVETRLLLWPALAGGCWGPELQETCACPRCQQGQPVLSTAAVQRSGALEPSNWLWLNSDSCRAWVGGQALPTVTRIPESYCQR